MQTQMAAKRSAEGEIFALLRQINEYAAAGDADEVSRLQLKISELQLRHGAVTGKGKDEHDERTA